MGVGQVRVHSNGRALKHWLSIFEWGSGCPHHPAARVGLSKNKNRVLVEDARGNRVLEACF